MYIILFKGADENTERYERRLKALGLHLEVLPLPDHPKWQMHEGRLADEWLSEEMAWLFLSRGESIDTVQFLLDDWYGPNNVIGQHYGRSFSGYRVCTIKNRKGWENTGEHELLHAANDIVSLYHGVSLSHVFGVPSFDEDVVHGRDSRFEEYQYDEVWKTVKPYLAVAVGKRKRMGYRSAMERLVVKLKEMVAHLQNRVEEITIPEEMVHPIPKAYRQAVSQRFLTPNDTYRSGVHNGTDWALPIGTPIRAPADGCVIMRFQGGETGYSCYFEFEWKGVRQWMRVLHLRELPATGELKAGDVIGYSGDTGKSTGPHCHLDLWRTPIAIDKILTEEGVIQNLIDPEAFFANAV